LSRFGYVVVGGRLKLSGVFSGIGILFHVLFYQLLVILVSFTLLFLLRSLYKAFNMFRVIFISITGFTALLYADIYFPGRTDPHILELTGWPWKSWAIWAIFILGSVWHLRVRKSKFFQFSTEEPNP